MQNPTIVDSGANYHMFNKREFFTSLVPTSGQVILGDGKTVLSIQSNGQVKCIIDDQILLINNVRFVLDLAESIYSLFLQIKQQHQGVYSSLDDGLHLKFPNFTTKTIVGNDDIYLDAQPHPSNPDFCASTTTSLMPPSLAPAYCHNTSESRPSENSKSPNNLLKSLRQYYSEVKTKQQLNLDVPAGFRSSSELQKDFKLFTPPCKARSAEVIHSTVSSDAFSDDNASTPMIDTLSSMTDDAPASSTIPSSPVNVPILRCVDKPSTSLPSRINSWKIFFVLVYVFAG
jgi:hypothetical protein